jgi:hypothetical protein
MIRSVRWWLAETWRLTLAPRDPVTDHEYEPVDWGGTWGDLCGHIPEPKRLHPACGRSRRAHVGRD